MDDLEKAKLKAEIREIKLRVATERYRIKNEKRCCFKFFKSLRSWATIFVTFIAIGSGIATIWMKSTTFLVQQKEDIKQNERNLEQKEKEYDFQVNKEMIILVKQLSAEKPSEREDAQLILSNFEKDALQILIRQLDRNDTPEAVIDSLKLVKEKLNSKIPTSIVIDKIFDLTKRVFDREYVNLSKREDVRLTSLINYLSALGELGDDKEKKRDIKDFLIKERNNASLMPSFKKKRIIEEIDIASKKLGIDLTTH